MSTDFTGVKSGAEPRFDAVRERREYLPGTVTESITAGQTLQTRQATILCVPHDVRQSLQQVRQITLVLINMCLVSLE
jgi:hypothetical protein